MMTTMATVGQLVVERPARARVFEKHGIDYCCGGKIPLDQACGKKGLDLQAILDELLVSDTAGGPSERNWAAASLRELADDIQATHHAYLKQELPRLERLVMKVAAVHGQNHPELAQVQRVFAALQPELEAHMRKEEVILFPLIRELEAADALHRGSVVNPITVMVREHDDAGAALAALRKLTRDYTPPEGACNSYRAMLSGLAELEADMHQHVHKENNILFPRAAKREAELAKP